MDLHATVGPARTTVSAVAQRAGVQRATVYRHFPSDGDLFAACSAQWIAAHPYPSPETWPAIGDPEQRVRSALSELYAYYRTVEPMLANVTRDAQLLPALRTAMAGATGSGRASRTSSPQAGPTAASPTSGGERRSPLALEFATWRVLATRLGDSESAALMTSMVAAAS